ncbi:MAG: hypothetical protein Q7R82_02180 [Candidatus Daviesbacteria bacterium]|nr:hypothetical protein [Candidatus Daviesbacteria bacterium]
MDTAWGEVIQMEYIVNIARPRGGIVSNRILILFTHFIRIVIVDKLSRKIPLHPVPFGTGLRGIFQNGERSPTPIPI